MPYSVEGCCEIDKHCTGLLSQKDILGVLRQQGDLIYGRPPVSKTLIAGEREILHCAYSSVKSKIEEYVSIEND